MIINGVFYQLLNVLILLMQGVGPTPVAGFPGGTTSAFLAANHATAQHSVIRLK